MTKTDDPGKTMERFSFEAILAEEHEKHHAKFKRCKVGQWMDTLDPETRLAIQNAEERKVTRVVIYRAAQRIGLPWGDSAFYHHLKGACACARG